ncbi:PREDICTED: juvenile hormone acid O-methyltransferase-like, partial [Dinoponera quadriceps]|uniref:Juvenile hormone acid O-methyltransferase-like n=1 Tax=Dinoponera quadriceps TaxID=609295 RepID=A0A6P3XW03_DINQU
IDEFDEELKHMSGKCMDVGCGPGSTTRYMLLLALDPKAVLIGTDISEIMITHANEVYGVEERLKFEILDIETKHSPEKYLTKYDYVFLFHTTIDPSSSDRDST